MQEVASILDFWFGPLDADGYSGDEYRQRWFSGRRTDAIIKHRFAELVQRAVAGSLADGEGQPGARMALILLLDQFTRNLYRGTSLAFSGDARALAVVRRAIQAGEDGSLPLVWRVFLYMPLEHAEDLQCQHLAVNKYEGLLDVAPPQHSSELERSADWARRHRNIIARFGRFPHRNAALQRESSAEEAAWLAAGADRFGQ